MICLKCNLYTSLLNSDLLCLISVPLTKRTRKGELATRIKADSRIGPHNKDILCFIFGTLLGDGHGEKRGRGTRISFDQCQKHKEYLL